MDAHVVIPPPDIELSIYVRVTEVTDKVGNKWKGVLVSYGDGIDLPVVLHWSHFAVLFVNREK